MKVPRFIPVQTDKPSRYARRRTPGRVPSLLLFLALAFCAAPTAASAAGESGPSMTVVPSSANPRGYSLTPSTTEPYATCKPQPPGVAVCLSISPPEGAPLSYPGGGKEKSGWAPTELRGAYKILATGGSGQTVAIVDAWGDTHANSDLEKYREAYELPPCTEGNGCFEKANQKGETANYPEESSAWAEETALDLDMVSAMCPECHIRLVEAESAGEENLLAAQDEAVKLTGKAGATTEISDSWTVDFGGEFPEETSDDSHFNHPGIPTTVAAGDVNSTFYPAVSPNVISVGGTVLEEEAKSSRGWKERVWPRTGGGCSQYESKPSWQTDWSCAKRTDNDVAADAELGISIYDQGWTSSGGTSASAPIVAGIVAHATKTVREQGAESFYRHALFDVAAGLDEYCNTYLCTAGEGYDSPTGWGTPNGPLESTPGFHAVTEEATAATETAGTLNGYVDPEGSATTYRFEYGQTTAYGHSVPASEGSVGSGVNWKAVSQSLSGLEKDQTYHYRVVAARGGETSYGPDHRFATIPWAVKTLPKPSETTETTYNSYLFGVSCSSTTTCTGVGWYTNKSNAQVGLAQRWNGTEWSLQSMATPEGGKVVNPQGVSCASSTSCVAVGSYKNSGGTTVSLAESWNGTTWTVQTTPNPEGSKATELLGVSCTSSTSCTAVGRYLVKEELFKQIYAPLVERWNGSSWSTQTTPAPEGSTYSELKSVSCTSAEACTAAGKLTNSSGKSAVLRWNGKEWTSQELSTTLTVAGVSCSSAEACTAVGGALTALRWNGKEWSVQTMPSPVASYESGQPGSSSLIGVSCSSANQCIAVGKLEREGEETTMADVWNGIEWAVQGAARPKEGVLNAVSCPADTACASVGSQYAYNAVEGTGYTHWMPLAENANLPAFGKPAVETTAATKVSGTTLQLNGTVNPEGLETKYYFEYGLTTSYGTKTSEVSAGFYRSKLEEGQTISGLKPNTTYHFRIVASNADGSVTGGDVAVTTTVWSLQSFPGASGAKWTAPRRVSCISSTECIAVGDYENSSGAKAPLAERWNGSEWSIQSTPSPSGAKWAALAGVSCTSSTACTAVGRYESSSSVEVTLAERWNGSEWTVQSTPNPSGAKSSWLEDVSCSSSTACTAIGRYVNSSSVEVTLAESWNGTAWSVQTTPNPSGAKWSRLADVSCTSSTACLTVGSYESSGSVRLTLAESWNGTTWSIQTTPNPTGSEWNSLKGVWCASATECTAVGGYRTSGEYVTLAERLKGTEWSIQTTPTPKRGSLLDISCASMSWCEATGTNEGKEPLAEHWNGSEWTIDTASVPTGVSVSALEGVSCITTCVSVGYTEVTNPGPLAESYPLRPPYAKTEPATSKTTTQATLKGIVDPDGVETKYYFEYGLTTSYETKTSEVSAGSGMSNVEASLTVSSLHPETLYHFRVAASNSEGTSYGKDTSFTTLAVTPSYKFYFGKQGPGPGEFEYPRGIAVDSSGNVWVADTSTNRIERFNEKGEYQSQFGAEGTGNGQFNGPAGIAVTSSGNLWVVDSGNDRVQEFNSKGEYLAKFGAEGSGNGQFIGPWGIAIAPDGHIWVADSGNNRIEEFTSTGEYVREEHGSGHGGSGNGEFSNPTGLGTDASGNVWVADTGNNRVQEISSTGAYLTQFGTKGSGNSQFEEPYGVAVKPTGNLLVVDKLHNRVEELTPSGEFLGEFGVGQSWRDEEVAQGAGGTEYLVDPADRVVFKYTQPARPEALTQAASGVKTTEATVNGTVNPSAVSTTYHFEYGKTTAYGTSVPVPSESVGSGTEAVAKSQTITGLTTKTTYHFRIVAENSEGTTDGKDLTFTTTNGTASELSAMAVTEPFSGTTESVSNFGSKWSALGWASGSPAKGEDTTSGWRPVSAFPTINGAYYGTTVTDTGAGIADVATMATNPSNAERYFSLWLDMPTPSSTRAGYELTFTDVSTGTYEVKLSKWVSGTQTSLATKASYAFANGNSFALVDQGGTVSAWTNTGSEFTELLSASDATFEGGNAAIEGAGNITRLTNFKVGVL